MPPIRNIRFSFPCKENIQEMSSCDLGKHCKSCSRTIIDFRNKSSEELDLLKKASPDICGIFSEKQVAKGYESYFQLAVATVLAIGLSSSFQRVHAQEEIDPFKFPSVSKDTIMENAVVGVIITDTSEPEYPGGIAAMRSFIQQNMIYPSDSITGKVVVSFVVDTAGRTQHIQINKSLSPLADAEVIRVVQLMHFKPAYDNGKPVNSRIKLPFTFSSGSKKENQ